MRSREWDRRAITLFLLLVVAVIVVDQHEPATLAVLLSTVGALLARIIAFYFPRPRRATKTSGVTGRKATSSNCEPGS